MSEKMIVGPVQGRKIRHLRLRVPIDIVMEVPSEKYYKVAVRAGDLVRLSRLPNTAKAAPIEPPVKKEGR